MTSNQTGWIGIAILAAVALLIAVASPLYVFLTARDETFTVEKTERVVSNTQDGQATSKFLVFTDKGVYENTDSWLKLKFNSSDVYGQLKSGQTYTCDVYGWRVPFLSAYPNIVACDAS